MHFPGSMLAPVSACDRRQAFRGSGEPNTRGRQAYLYGRRKVDAGQERPLVVEAWLGNTVFVEYLGGEPLESDVLRRIAAENKLGTYRCEAVEAEYPGGRKVAFAGVPDIGIEIAEEEIPPPEILGDWEWRKET